MPHSLWTLNSEQELAMFLSSEKVKSVSFSSKSIPQIIPQNEQHVKTRSSFSPGKEGNDQLARIC